MITFITPSIGRSTLSNTINSVINQTNSDWQYIIGFDGVNPEQHILDLINSNNKISYHIFPKTGIANRDGNVRNAAIHFATTEWIGFVDDDDTLTDDYVSKLKEELMSNIQYDCIIFRMIYKNGIILPELNNNNFPEEDHVGISFCYKKELFDNGLCFIPSRIEDYELLTKIKNKNYKILLSEHICYNVR